jgi:hypothetical protein
MLKNKKFLLVFIVLILLILAIFLGFSYKKGYVFYDRVRSNYMNVCNSSIKKSILMSNQAVYSSCSCSYDKILNLIGKEKMRGFSKVILEKDANKTNKFLKDKEINVRELDSYFFSCMR